MTSFNEAQQAKLALKMKLSQHAFYRSSWVESDEGDWGVVVDVNVPSPIGDGIRKLIPQVVSGVSVRTTNSGK